MADVSLIFTMSGAGRTGVGEIAGAREALESAGFQVEVVLAVPLGTRLPIDLAGDASGPDGQGLNVVEATERGRAAAGIAGVQRARGDRILVVNPERGYSPADLVKVARTLEPSRAEVVVASRLMGTPVVLPKAFLGKFLHRLTGSSDPLSGLVGITRPALESALEVLEPVGSQFSLELLTKVRCQRIDVPARPVPMSRQVARPGFDDLRHLKHLADFRFGNVSRLMQFCVVGASGMVVDLTCYALFQVLFSSSTWLATNPVPPTQVPWALALARASAIGVALIWNFSLNRRMTFSYARGGSILRQFVAYVLSNMLGITVSMLLSLGLPSRVAFFHDHKLLAALVGIVAATGISFTMSRWLVFRGTTTTIRPALREPYRGFDPSPVATDAAVAEPGA